jgi:anti-sigma regulatory factor (Ser/Thr protein kinase)
VNGELRRRLQANQDAIEAFCWDFQQWLGAETTAKDAFASELLLREALVNAVEHGSKCAGHVECVVRGGKGRLFIAVCDEGKGFDWGPRWHRTAPVDACSGRGVMIYRTYAHRVRFNRAGNTVFLQRRLEGGNATETAKERQ